MDQSLSRRPFSSAAQAGAEGESTNNKKKQQHCVLFWHDLFFDDDDDGNEEMDAYHLILSFAGGFLKGMGKGLLGAAVKPAAGKIR